MATSKTRDHAAAEGVAGLRGLWPVVVVAQLGVSRYTDPRQWGRWVWWAQGSWCDKNARRHHTLVHGTREIVQIPHIEGQGARPVGPDGPEG